MCGFLHLFCWSFCTLVTVVISGMEVSCLLIENKEEIFSYVCVCVCVCVCTYIYNSEHVRACMCVHVQSYCSESDKNNNEWKTAQVNRVTNIPLFFSTFILTKQPWIIQSNSIKKTKTCQVPSTDQITLYNPLDEQFTQ